MNLNIFFRICPNTSVSQCIYQSMLVEAWKSQGIGICSHLSANLPFSSRILLYLAISGIIASCLIKCVVYHGFGSVSYFLVAYCHVSHGTAHTYVSQVLHLAKTEEQGQLFLQSVATTRIWSENHQYSAGVRNFWNSYCVTMGDGQRDGKKDWFRWSFFATEGVPVTTPNSNPIESWHNAGVKQLLKGRMKGSTAYVLEKALPDVMDFYSTCSPPTISSNGL